MIVCSECGAKLQACPHCKQPLKDRVSSFLFQVSIVFILAAGVFASLEIKVKEETEMAMKPFQAAEESNQKRTKLEDAKDPAGVKADKKSAAKTTDKKEKKEEKPETGRKADFRVAYWGMTKDAVKEKEGASPSPEGFSKPGLLSYIAKVGSFNTIVQYHFSSNTLIGGTYLVFGKPIKKTRELMESSLISIGELADTYVSSDMGLYPQPRNEGLSTIDQVDSCFYEMYLSITSIYGPPSKKPTDEISMALSRKEKVLSVIARDRMLSYKWRSDKTYVELIFASHKGTPYFKINYRGRKYVAGVF
jgi:hypothetical protein